MGENSRIARLKKFYLFETHMPLADNARKHACQMLVDAVSDEAKDNTPAFCTGDFNATPDAPEIATTICQSGILKDAYREAAVQHGAFSLHFLLKRPELIFIFCETCYGAFYPHYCQFFIRSLSYGDCSRNLKNKMKIMKTNFII